MGFWRPVLTIGSWLGYLLGFYWLQDHIGVSVSLCVLPAILLSAWVWRKWGGLIGGFAASVITLSLWYYLPAEDQQSIQLLFSEPHRRITEIVLYLSIGFMAGLAADLQHRLRKYKQANQQAQYDPLTGLLNRKSFEHRLEAMIATSQQNQTLLAVLFLDLDKFKAVNDTYGHDIGDELLKAVARVLKSTVRDNDAVARLGGDEFMVILGNLRETSSATSVANKIVKAIGQPFKIRGKELHIGASVGISLFPEDGTTSEALVKAADNTMYAVKASGKNDYKLNTAAHREEESKRQEIEVLLKMGIDRNEFELFFQPQIELKNHQILGFEVFLRWRNSNLGVVTPTEFLPIAEQAGMLPTLSHWALREACHQLSDWQKRFRPFKLSINISAQHFSQKDFVGHVEKVLREFNLQPNRLEIELSEQTLSKDYQQTSKVLHQLAKLGVGITLDDFGTSFSSLVHLQRLPINTLKIDHHFIKTIADTTAEGQSNAIFVESVCALGQKFNKHVIAEGVENKVQHETVSNLGCYGGQGYYYARPLSVKEVEAMLEKWQHKHLSKR
jgi:diguanylate cyclase (GGDEF)-like protein